MSSILRHDFGVTEGPRYFSYRDTLYPTVSRKLLYLHPCETDVVYHHLQPDSRDTDIERNSIQRIKT